MGMNAWNCLPQSQFVTLKIFIYKIFKQKQYKKYILISSQKKKKKSKQFNFYKKLTKEKYNFDSNQIFSKLWLYIYIYI